jgi:MoxR-like ATPase
MVEHLLFEVKRLIVGQDHVIERLLVALLARGHVLLEGVPGLAKTATIRALAQVVGGTFGRVQFTPDLIPADLVGTRIYNGKTGEFTTELGPIFVNLLLADEINRAPAKVQSALWKSCRSARSRSASRRTLCRSVSGPCHPKPDRVGRHLSLARSAA